MRKLLWCCTAAGVLATGSLLSATYYGCCHPDSGVGRFLVTTAQATVAIQPFTGVASLAARSNQAGTQQGEIGSIEDSVPADPQPIAPEVKEAPKEEPDEVVLAPIQAIAPEGAAIVIPEDDPIPHVEPAPIAPSTIDMENLKGQEVPGNVCPIVMPYCSDDEAKTATPPIMPYADEKEQKSAKKSKKDAPATEEESEENVFKAWMKVWESGSESKTEPAEELPFPKEEPQSEPKWQEDSQLHEHYPGTPHTTSPHARKGNTVKSVSKK